MRRAQKRGSCILLHTIVSKNARPFLSRLPTMRTKRAYIIDIKRGTRLITLIKYNPRCAQKNSTSETVRNKHRKSLRLRRAPVSVILRGLGTIINNTSIASSDIQCVSELLYFFSTCVPTKKKKVKTFSTYDISNQQNIARV